VLVQQTREVAAEDLDRPATSRNTMSRGEVRAAMIASSTPIRLSTDRCASPRKSTAWPPSRNEGARSTTTAVMPERVSQWASAGPAIPAPEISTSMPGNATPGR
jgi:hypothetical protein